MTTPATPTRILRNTVPVLPRGHFWGVRDYHTTLEQRAIAGGLHRRALPPASCLLWGPGQEALIEVILRHQFDGKVPETLAAAIATGVAAKTSCRSDVTVEVIPVLTHAGIPHGRRGVVQSA